MPGIRTLTKEEAAHIGMQTVRFTCARGDTHSVHGHTSSPAHRHEIYRVRNKLAKGCTALHLKPGKIHRPKMKNGRIVDPTAPLGDPCGAVVTMEVINHPTPARVEPTPPTPDPAPPEPPAEAPAKPMRRTSAG